MYIKTNRVFNPIRQWSWILTLVVGLGGLFYPRLGLLVIPVMLTLTTLALFKGRYWCGNFCSHGSFFDVLLMPFSRNTAIPKFLKSRITAWLFFAFFGWNIGTKFVRVAGLRGTMDFWDRLGMIFVGSYLMVIVAGGVLALTVSPRTWCSFCPMGTLQVLSYKLGKLLGIAKKSDQRITIANQDMCHACGKCARVCPLQLEPYQAFNKTTNQFDAEVCIRCSTCVFNCPAGILSLDSQDEAIQIKEGTSSAGYEQRVEIAAVVKTIRSLGGDVLEFTFALQQPRILSYQAGQFLLVKIQDEPTMFRAYSIAGYDRERGEVRIAVKKAPNGYGTGILFEDFFEGMAVTLEGPMGHELIVDAEAENVVLVAGGIGITPFLPIVEDILKNKPHIKQVTLVYGVNKSSEFLYEKEFQQLQAKDARFAYIPVVASDEQWTGAQGFVTDVMKDMDLSASMIYMCGPKPMTNAALGLLSKIGVDTERVFLESA